MCVSGQGVQEEAGCSPPTVRSQLAMLKTEKLKSDSTNTFWRVTDVNTKKNQLKGLKLVVSGK